jgi:hypothetical protein
MEAIALVILGPFLVDLVLLKILTATHSRISLVFVALAYVVLNVVLPILGGWIFVRSGDDWTEFVSLVAIVLVTRVIDLFGFRGWFVFRSIWQSTNARTV